MQKHEILVSQIKEIKHRIDHVFVEWAFFELSPIENQTPVLRKAMPSLFDLDDHFHHCGKYYQTLVTSLRHEKMVSPLYQRCLGIGAVLDSIGVGVSNIDTTDLDIAGVKQLYLACTDRLISIEERMMSKIMPAVSFTGGKTPESYSTCEEFLQSINHLIAEIVRLEGIQSADILTPRYDIFSER